MGEMGCGGGVGGCGQINSVGERRVVKIENAKISPGKFILPIRRVQMRQATQHRMSVTTPERRLRDAGCHVAVTEDTADRIRSKMGSITFTFTCERLDHQP